MSRDFECCWESMRDVPRATIDLGSGQVIERTIGGNVITWFCLADGRAFDVQPGLLDASSYQAALRSAAETHRSLVPPGSGALRLTDEHLAAHVLRVARPASNGWARYVGSQLDALGPRSAVCSPGDRLGAIVEPFAASSEPLALERTLLKRAIELPLIGAVVANESLPEAPAQAVPTMLAREAELSRTVLRPQALGLLCCAPLSTPSELAPHVYRLVFATDLADPFLSMAPPVLGRRDGFTGTHSPALSSAMH